MHRKFFYIWTAFGIGFLAFGWGLALDMMSFVPLIPLGLLAAFCFSLALIELGRMG